MKDLCTLGLVLTCLATLPLSASADERVVSTALGREGQLISLLSGTYGELFPGGSEAQDEVTVLALRRTLPDGQLLVDVVPATLNGDTEEAAELVVEPVSGVSYVFWQSWTNRIHSRLLVSSFNGESWNEPIEVSESPFAWQTSPAFAVTRDSFTDLADEDSPQVARTVLHVVWTDEGEANRWNTKYAPLVLEDGEYIGDHPVLVLNDLVQVGEGATSTNLQLAPVLRAREGENRVVTAFVDQRSGEIATVEISFAAGEIGIVGDSVASEVEAVASRTDLTGQVGVDLLVEAVRSRILSFGDEVKAEILGPLAGDLAKHLRDLVPERPTDVGRIRGDARAHVIDVGFRLTDGRVRRVTGGARAHVIDVGVHNDGPRRRHRHDMRSSVASSRPIPVLTGTPDILVSPQGSKLMLTWADAQRVYYRESNVSGDWSAVQYIQLTDQIDRAKALSILQARVDQQ
jgi:hypothetical protein